MPDLITGAEGAAFIGVSTNDSRADVFATRASDHFERLAHKRWTTTTQVERHSGGTSSIVLGWPPVASITSIDDDGTTISSSDYVLDSETGVITFDYPLSGRKNRVVVTYVTGGTIPELAKEGALVMFGHKWSTQRNTGGTRPNTGESFDEPAPSSSAFAVPNRVREILETLGALGGMG